MCRSYEYSRSFIYLWQPDTNKSSPATLSLCLNSVRGRNLPCTSRVFITSLLLLCYILVLWNFNCLHIYFVIHYGQFLALMRLHWSSCISEKWHNNGLVTFISPRPSLFDLRLLPGNSSARCPRLNGIHFSSNIINCFVNHTGKKAAESQNFNYHRPLILMLTSVFLLEWAGSHKPPTEKNKNLLLIKYDFINIQ